MAQFQGLVALLLVFLVCATQLHNVAVDSPLFFMSRGFHGRPRRASSKVARGGPGFVGQGARARRSCASSPASFVERDRVRVFQIKAACFFIVSVQFCLGSQVSLAPILVGGGDVENATAKLLGSILFNSVHQRSLAFARR